MKKRYVVAIMAMAVTAAVALTPLQTQAASGVKWSKFTYIIKLPCPPDNTPDFEIPDDSNKPDDSDTPDIEQPDTELTYSEQVVKLVNKERAREGLKALTIKEDVTAAAQVRAKEIVTTFSHSRPDGRSCFTALKEQGVSYRGAGENIAWGQKSPEAVVKGWMNSEGHKANILNEKFTSIGVGYYQDSNGRNYWTQFFTY